MDLGDLILVGREAARACREIVSENPPDGVAVPLFATDHPDDDRTLGHLAIRSAQIEHVVDRALQEHAVAIARSGFLPPPALDGWRTPSEAAWDLGIDRFVLSGARAYLERMIESGGDGMVMPWALQPTSTSDLAHVRTSKRPAASHEHRSFPDQIAEGTSDTAGARLAVVGWSMGEVRIELVLRLAADPLRAIGAANGWAGDRIAWYAAHPTGSQRPVGDLEGLVLWSLRFETDEDARELVDGFRKLFERRFAEHGDPGLTVDRERADLTWARASADDRDWGIARRHGSTVRLALSPSGPLPPWASNWVAESP